MTIKNDTYYKFNSKEDYIDFLETAEKEGFEWFCGQKPTDKKCLTYFDGDDECCFYIHTNNCNLLSFGNGYSAYSAATLWAKENPKGITATIIAHDVGKFWLEKNEFNALYKGDFKEMKIIINEPAVVLIKNGKKYVSKAHDEEFDAEKGLLMCLAKANGVTHLDLKRMLKNATYQSKKCVEIDRKPKVGDYVKIIKHFPGEDRVKIGEIYKVELVTTSGEVIVSNDKHKDIMLIDCEYRVLEGYKA